MKKCAVPGCKCEAGLVTVLCKKHLALWKKSAEAKRWSKALGKERGKADRQLADFVDRIDAEERNGSKYDH